MTLKKILAVLGISLPGLLALPLAASDENYRPAFHYAPQHNWMNDPNGMVYVDGEYHLFYQYNPYGHAWGPMHWGHAVSRDLYSWQELPIALYPDQLGTIFSGSAVFDKNNTSGLGTKDNPPLVAIYTYNHQFREHKSLPAGQSQALAYSLDKGRSWQKYAHNPVLTNPTERDFRDPKVFWFEADQKWIMSLAVNKKISFYSSSNLIQWQHESDLAVDLSAENAVVECPDLIPLYIEGSTTQKYVLLVSVNHGAVNGGSGTQYFVGDFDGKTFSLDSQFSAQLQQNIQQGESPAEWLDYGADNYAGVGWSNLPDQRALTIGWMNNWDYAQNTPLKSWRGAMTLPRELSLAQTNGRYVVKSIPAREITARIKQNIALTPNKISGKYELLTAQGLNEFPQYVQLQLNSQAGSRIELELGAGRERSRLTIDRDQMQVLFDRNKSGLTGFSDKFVGVQRAPLRSKQDNITLELYIDNSSIEIFINQGEVVFTNQIFPTQKPSQLIIKSNKPLALTAGHAGYF